MTKEQLEQLDARMHLLRLECWREIKESADKSPAYTLLRVYSKMKMLCEFYDGLRKAPVVVTPDEEPPSIVKVFGCRRAIFGPGVVRAAAKACDCDHPNECRIVDLCSPEGDEG